MIWSWVINSKLARWIGVALAVAVAVLTFGRVQRSRGKKDAEIDALEDAYNRVEQGRQHLRDGRDNGTPDERLRDNDGRW